MTLYDIETTIPRFEQCKTIHALDDEATGTGIHSRE
jgi:hypothetical protein